MWKNKAKISRKNKTKISRKNGNYGKTRKFRENYRIFKNKCKIFGSVQCGNLWWNEAVWCVYDIIGFNCQIMLVNENKWAVRLRWCPISNLVQNEIRTCFTMNDVYAFIDAIKFIIISRLQVCGNTRRPLQLIAKHKYMQTTLFTSNSS